MLSDGLIAALIGFGGGVLLGLAARRGRFCTLGAIEDALYGQDWRRARMWALALGLSIPVTIWLGESGRIECEPADPGWAHRTVDHRQVAASGNDPRLSSAEWVGYRDRGLPDPRPGGGRSVRVSGGVTAP